MFGEIEVSSEINLDVFHEGSEDGIGQMSVSKLNHDFEGLRGKSMDMNLELRLDCFDKRHLFNQIELGLNWN